MKSDYYKHGFQTGYFGQPMEHDYELEHHKHDFQEGWYDGMTKHINELIAAKKAKGLDNSF